MTRGTDRKARTHRATGSTETPAIILRDAARIHPGLTLPVLACTGVVASMLSPSSAVAVSLGDLRVQSTLGQALQATIPVETSAGEYVGGSCVSAINSTDPDLRSVPAARVQMPESGNPGVHELVVTTSGALFEPMYALALQVRCPGTALVVRQYVLMLDLPSSTPAVTAAPVMPVTASVPTEAPAAAVQAAASAEVVNGRAGPSAVASAPKLALRGSSRLAPTGEAISRGSRYRVRQGDTLSGIAARVTERGGARLRPFAEQILVANPGAFVRGNPDLIKLGSEIVIPSGTAAAEAVASAPLAKVAAPAAAPEVTQPSVQAGAPATAPAPVAEQVASTPAAAAPAASPVAEQVATPHVFADEPTGKPAVAPKAANEPVAPVAPGASGSHPVLSALTGLLIGIVLSLALMRQRLTDGLARLLGRRSDEDDMGLPVTRAATRAAPVRPVRPKRLRPSEGTMVVEESRVEAEDRTDEVPVVAPVVAVGEPRSANTGQVNALSPTATMAALPAADLGALFDDPAITAELPGTGTLRSREKEADESLDLDLTGALDVSAEFPRVEDIGWVGDESDLTQTRRAPEISEVAADEPANIALDKLAQVDNSDARLSDTLREALALLEKDYEDEFSASQVLDIRQTKGPSDEAIIDDATIARTGTDHGRK